jgi:MSHA pilin protein MshC
MEGPWPLFSLSWFESIMNSGTRVEKGFSLTELVVVIVIIGIIAVVVLPRINLTLFEQAGFFQQSLAAIRHGQKLAIASGCDVDVVINSTSCTLTWSGSPAGCPATAIDNTATGAANFCQGGTAEGSPSVNITFDNIGRPDAQKTIVFGSRTIRVEAETGYTHEI